MKHKRITVRKLFTSLGFLSLFITSSQSTSVEIVDNGKQINNIIKSKSNDDEILNISNDYSIPSKNHHHHEPKLLANESLEESNVLISEIIIEGWEDHPEGRKLELVAYDSMSIKPGSVVNNEILKNDINNIYASGLFSGVKFKAEDGNLGVKLIVTITPNPILKKVIIDEDNIIIPQKVIDKTFSDYYGTTLNLIDFQKRLTVIKNWYKERGYSIARINGPERILESGVIALQIEEGLVSEIKIRFIDADEDIQKKGKTKEWVIRREMKTIPGAVFNRITLENDIKRLYATSLFNDVKVSLSPDSISSKKVVITLDISEQRTGSLNGGIGFSNAAGIFAQLGFKESNTFGRAWSSSLNIDFGEYLTTYNLSIFDPWIKGDKHRTAFRTNLYLSRNYPREFSSEGDGKLYAVNDLNSNSSDNFSSLVLQTTGGGFSFIRPLNGGDPFQKTPWRVTAGMNFKEVKLIDSVGNKKPYATKNPTTANENDIICAGYKLKDGTCPDENTLISVATNASRNKLNNNNNPTSGNILRFGSEQFLPLGDNSPTFNRLRASYAWFVPTKLINLTKGCKDKNADANSCPQTLGFQFKFGTIIGELPPYEAFCMGGASSVRGWGSCGLGVSRSFAEATAEYRFPIWKMLSGSFFADLGSDFGSQDDVPGKPGKLLSKQGSGYSLGGGIGVKTPIGPLRLDIASQDLSGNMRYTLGVGWKF
tara:strand:+ start:79 stop:2208 length:2130 start_codon:yes stop_codon:yes gene_type:complete